MKQLLGPKSMDKLIVNNHGETILTNDGVTALENMEIEHPAAKLLVQLSRAMDDAHGDGTTSVVVLAGELLKQARGLLDQGVHAIKIIKAFMSAALRSSEIIMEMSRSFDPTSEEGRNILIETAKTALHSKLVSHAAPHLALLAVDALLSANKQSSNLQNDTANYTPRHVSDLHVVLVNGGLFEESRLVPGIILENSMIANSAGNASSSDANLRPLALALLQFPLSKPKPPPQVKVVLSTNSDVDKILREEEAYIKSLVVAIKKLGIEAIGIEDQVIEEVIPDTAKSLLTKVKIKILPKLNRKTFMMLSNSLGCTPITSPDMLSNPESKKKLCKASTQTRACVEPCEPCPAQTSSSSNSSHSNFENFENLAISAKPAQTHGSVVLCGGSELYLAEAERAFHDAARVVSTLLSKPQIVPGAGVCESEVSVRIEKEASFIQDVSGLVWSSFASAMEAIPLTLARNAGMDSLNIMAELKAKHNSPEGRMYGVNVFEECVEDMQANHVWEPSVNKQAQCIMAAEVATSILKIDSIHKVNEIISEAARVQAEF